MPPYAGPRIHCVCSDCISTGAHDPDGVPIGKTFSADDFEIHQALSKLNASASHANRGRPDQVLPGPSRTGPSIRRARRDQAQLDTSRRMLSSLKHPDKCEDNVATTRSLDALNKILKMVELRNSQLSASLSNDLLTDIEKDISAASTQLDSINRNVPLVQSEKNRVAEQLVLLRNRVILWRSTMPAPVGPIEFNTCESFLINLIIYLLLISLNP